MRSLKELLTPYPLDKFVKEVWSKEYLYIPGDSSKFETLFSWDILNRALEQHRLEPPRLRLEKTGTPREDLEFLAYRPARRGGTIPRIDVPLLHKHLRDGATLVFDAFDEISGPIAQLCESLTSHFLTHIQVNLYASWGSTRGFGLHWDDHDVIILHLSGSKHWQVYGPTRTHPLYRDTTPNHERPVKPLFDQILTSGDFLYIPRGHWHDVVGTNEPTAHLTFGITNSTGIDLLFWIAENCRDVDFLRQDLPLFADSQEKKRYMKLFQSIVTGYLTDGSVLDYFTARAAQLGPRPHLSLPYAACSSIIAKNPDLPFRYLEVAPIEPREENGEIVIRAHGREWRFSSEARAVVNLLLSRKLLTLSDVAESAPHIPREDIACLIDNLLHAGLIFIEPSSS